MKTPNGSVRVMEDVPSIQELTDHGASVVSSDAPQAVLDGMFYRQRRNSARYGI